MSEYKQPRFTAFQSDIDETWSLENFEVQYGNDGHLPTNRVADFISKYHYSGGMGNAAIPYECVHEQTGDLVGVIAFHAPISENVRASVFGDGRENEVIELHRMAIHPDAPKNTATWFISRALDRLKGYKPQYRAVLSFADTTEGHDGTVYQAASADYTGMTAESTFYQDENGRLRAPRQNGENIDPGKTDWKPVKRKSKHRYVFYLPDKYESKQDVREESQLESKAYP